MCISFLLEYEQEVKPFKMAASHKVAVWRNASAFKFFAISPEHHSDMFCFMFEHSCLCLLFSHRLHPSPFSSLILLLSSHTNLLMMKDKSALRHSRLLLSFSLSQYYCSMCFSLGCSDVYPQAIPYSEA